MWYLWCVYDDVKIMYKLNMWVTDLHMMLNSWFWWNVVSMLELFWF